MGVHPHYSDEEVLREWIRAMNEHGCRPVVLVALKDDGRPVVMRGEHTSKEHSLEVLADVLRQYFATAARQRLEGN